MNSQRKERLFRYFRAALAAVEPSRLVASALRKEAGVLALSVPGGEQRIPLRSLRNVYLVGGGKAGRTMGEAAVAALGDLVAEGVLAVPHGAGGASGKVRLVEGGHPVPDLWSLAVARETLTLLEFADEGDLAIALVSGGGSSMISAPVPGIAPEEKAAVFRLLLRAGADIVSLNTVRKHLSEIKGGNLARAAYPATVWALLLSDVPGDDPSVIASGPFSPDATTYSEAIGVLERHGLMYAVPAAVRRHLVEGMEGRIPETPKPGDPVFEKVICVLVGSNETAMRAAAKEAAADGAEIVLLPGFLQGEARECAKAFCSRLRAAAATLPPGRSVVLLAGGETTVQVRGNGKGGRSQEFALAAAMELENEGELAVLAGGTDGVDGPTDAAGAYADGTTLARAGALGLSARNRLEANDAYPFFQALGDLVVTGPTGTNVTDLAIGFANSTG